MKVNYPYCISIDWLTLFMTSTRDLSGYLNKKTEYREGKDGQTWYVKLVPAEYGTRVFANRVSVEVTKGKRLTIIGTLLFKPKSSIIRQDACQFTFKNCELYTSSWLADISLLQEVLGLKYESVTRIDLAYDCNKFKNGRTPRTLIKQYLDTRILKIGNNSPVVHYHSFGYFVARPKGEKDQFSLRPVKQQEVNLSEKEVNAITWGTHASGVQVQLYNKSLELKDNFKKWIYDSWVTAGLDTANVWRTEVRIQDKGKDLLRFEDGTIFQLGLSDVMDQDSIERLFYTYALKYMRFVVRDYHAKKQHMKPVDLFCIHLTPIAKPKIQRVATSATRTVKVVANYIELLSYCVEQGLILKEYPAQYVEQLRHIENDIRANFSLAAATNDRDLLKQKQYAALIKRLANEHTFNKLATLFNSQNFCAHSEIVEPPTAKRPE